MKIKSVKLKIGLILCILAPLPWWGGVGGGFAQDSKSQYHPINHAVISQTIAPDARSAGMGDIGAATDPAVLLPILMSTHSIGILLSIRSVSVRLVWH